MGRQSKVESSPHFKEIVDLMLTGKSGRSISQYLKEKYDEDIGFNAINVYRRNHIHMEDRVEAELNKRAEKKKTQKKKKTLPKNNDDSIKDTVQEQVKEQADIKESVDDTISSVTQTIADNMEGVAKVAAELPLIFERVKEEAENQESKTEWKDVANLSIQANKIYNDYFKHEENNIEININEGFEELANAISKSREAIKD